MTSRQIEIIENSWDFILLDPQGAGEIFYSKLFTLEPSLRRLFNEDIKSQSQKLISMITFFVHKVNDLDELMSDVRDLGVRHKKYNVRQEHFTIVATALLWTLENKLGKSWDEETKNAWVTMYSIISKTMIDAVNESQTVEL